MTESQNGYIAGLSALVVVKTQGEGLAKQGAAIARADAFDSEMDTIAANNNLITMRIKNGMLNDKITRLASENSELRGLLEKRDEILGKIRAGIKAKIMSSDAIAAVVVNYGRKTGMTPDEIKNDVIAASERAKRSNDSYSKKADEQLVLAGADDEVMAALNSSGGGAVDSRNSSPGADNSSLASNMLLDAKTSMESSIANKTQLDVKRMLQLVVGAMKLIAVPNEIRPGGKPAGNNGTKP